MPRTLAWLLLRLFHLIFRIVNWISHYADRCARLLRASPSGYLRFNQKKGPWTVAVVLESGEVLGQELKILELLQWLAAARVQHVSLYDVKGVLKNLQEDFEKALDCSCGEDQKLSFHSPRKEVMKVELLSREDGREAIVMAARHICSGALKAHAQGKELKKKLTEADVDASLLAAGYVGPEPDLLLSFGTTKSLLGFPPWRLRLTEIVHMGRFRDLTAPLFTSALEEFSQKTQRYGT